MTPAPSWNVLGLTDRELRVYETLLAAGACTISALAHQARLDQRSVYDYVERLAHKGLVGEIATGNKRTFLALNPSTLSHLLTEERVAVVERFARLDALTRSTSGTLTPHLLPDKKSFFALVRRTRGPATAFFGARHEAVVTNPNWKFFISQKGTRVEMLDKKFTAAVVAIVTTERFLLYSIADEQGFFVDDSAFAGSMKVYFAGVRS
jgi:hypothetical protein